MRKADFLTRLEKGLSALPRAEREERLTFYREMIEDRMEEGLAEEDAVRAIGRVEDILAELPSEKPEKGKKRLRAWEIVLLALGSPVWLSLLIAAFAVLLSLYLSVWAILVSFWAVFASFIGTAVGGVVAGAVWLACGNGLVGAAMLGAALALTGLSIFCFYGCRAATDGTVWLTKRIWKRVFCKKEEA